MQKIKHWVKNHRKTTIGTAIVLVLVIGMGIINKIKQNKAAQSSRYVVAKVAKTTPLTLTGTVVAQQQQVLSLPSGKVQSIGVANGQKVSEGDPLVTTYSESANEELADAKQELIKAQRNVTAQQNNVSAAQSEDGTASGSASSVAQAQASLADAQSDVTAVQNKVNTLSQKVTQTLTAPFDGTVTVDDTKQDAPVITIYSNDLKFKSKVSEYNYSKLKTGQEIHVRALATGKQADTTISYLATVPTTNSQSNGASYEVDADLSSKDFMDGQTVKASVAQNQLRIPKSSVKNGQVYVVKNGKAKAVAVSGKRVNEYFEVKSGVKAGQQIVTNPDSKLHNGTKVSADGND
ncbi:efflux RND transporter periplasmic adaptor subunit [Limosilactobacillus mucosae]|uniref:efflux RND transporter periplasmic adaptor subunit n=1 Tax=Limosilactobacillus mucosae TaxID=97478 RepID=UPI0022E88241|nr:efflux RND transporter periplasmic adaptor subunit [Limosilactobacillus mucosae]